VELRKEVVMYVDPRLGRNLRGRRREAPNGRQQAQSSRPSQEASPRGVCRRVRRLAARAAQKRASFAIGTHPFLAVRLTLASAGAVF
jgi:hypothetical protein